MAQNNMTHPYTPLTRVSIKTDVFRRDLRIRGLRLTIGATVQKVKFWSTLKPLTVQTFFCVTITLLIVDN
jgi:hypothetical protein